MSNEKTLENLNKIKFQYLFYMRKKHIMEKKPDNGEKPREIREFPNVT
jgi:hypothetical protein